LIKATWICLAGAAVVVLAGAAVVVLAGAAVVLLAGAAVVLLAGAAVVVLAGAAVVVVVPPQLAASNPRARAISSTNPIVSTVFLEPNMLSLPVYQLPNPPTLIVLKSLPPLL